MATSIDSRRVSLEEIGWPNYVKPDSIKGGGALQSAARWQELSIVHEGNMKD